MNKPSSKSNDTKQNTSNDDASFIETLQEQLSQKTVALEAAKKGLETISYTISHDLRAPLRTIDSFSQALTEDFGAQLPEEALNHIARIRKATTHMTGMIDELLELARVNRRKMLPQEINVSKLVKDIIEDLSLEDPGRNIEFTVEDNMQITGDKHLLKIALHHLLHNAWKFSQKQSLAKVDVASVSHNGNTVFSIKDNGCGFDMNYYDQLFDPFKRLHNDDEFTGMGIGLTTAKQIIERHNGKIWADSEPNKGACFYFRLGNEYQN